MQAICVYIKCTNNVHIKDVRTIYVEHTRILHDNILYAWHCICRFCIHPKMNNSIYTLTDTCQVSFCTSTSCRKLCSCRCILFTLCTGGSCKHTFKHLFLFTYQSLHNFRHPVWLASTAILPVSPYSIYLDTSSLMYPVLISITTVSNSRFSVQTSFHSVSNFTSFSMVIYFTLKQSVFLHHIKYVFILLTLL